MTAYANPKPLSLRARWLRPFIRLTLQRVMGSAMPHVQQRRALERAAAGIAFLMPRGVVIRPLALAGIAGLSVAPKDGDNGNRILYFHGGGYAVGSPMVYRPLAARLARLTGAAVLLPDYRLAPVHPFPAAVDDALAAYRALLDAGTPAGRIVLGGDSAGGGLSLACSLSIRAAGLPQPAGVVCFSPWTDLTQSGESIRSNAATELVLSPREAQRFVRSYLGAGDQRQPLASPLFADLRGLPQLLIQVTDREILLDDSIRLAAAAKSAGVQTELQIWQGLWHVWQTMPVLLPEADEALAIAAQFIVNCLD